MAAQIPCPHCGTVLALSDAYYGKQVRCRQCNQVFRAEPPTAAPTPPLTPSPVEVPRTAPPPVPRKPAKERRLERPRDDEPPRQSNKKLVLGLILGVLLLGCTGVSVGGVMVYRWIDRKAERIRKLQQELVEAPPDGQREAPPPSSRIPARNKNASPNSRGANSYAPHADKA